MTPRLTTLLTAIAVAATGSLQHAIAGKVRLDGGTTGSGEFVQVERDLLVPALEARLFRDASDGHWDEHTLFAASVIASGVASEAELRGTCDLFAVVAAELKTEPGPTATAEQRAEKTLAFLHRRLLSNGYDLYATELPHVLATGRYNCVSATVLFNCLAAEAGLKVCALRLPSHTCTELAAGNQRIRVETTRADWFLVRDRAPNHADSDGETFVAGARTQTRPNETISDVALVAMIYYNRGVEALRRTDSRAAIELNRRALWLDPHNTDARGNLLAALGKQAIKLAARREYSAAIELVDEGLRIEPNHEPLRQNRAYIDRQRSMGATP
jgi:hypothetical protein